MHLKTSGNERIILTIIEVRATGRITQTNMIIKNKTENAVAVVILGEQYSVDAQSTVEVPDSVGSAWLKIHEFLVVDESVPEQEISATDEVVVEKRTKKSKK